MRAMRAGFTGTQAGMTDDQYLALYKLLFKHGVTELYHGDCIGSDQQAYKIAKVMGIRTVCFPPDKAQKRAFTVNDKTHPPLPYLERNCKIVDSSDILLATPKTDVMVVRSGTWYTVRKGIRKADYPVTVILPDGELLTWPEEGLPMERFGRADGRMRWR